MVASCAGVVCAAVPMSIVCIHVNIMNVVDVMNVYMPVMRTCSGLVRVPEVVDESTKSES